LPFSSKTTAFVPVVPTSQPRSDIVSVVSNQCSVAGGQKFDELVGFGEVGLQLLQCGN